MARPLLTELVLFFAPFAFYALVLLATKRGGALDRAHWPVARVLWLLVAAFLSVIIGFVALAQLGGSPPRSTYVPAHVEDGKFVPGQTK